MNADKTILLVCGDILIIRAAWKTPSLLPRLVLKRDLGQNVLIAYHSKAVVGNRNSMCPAA
jgi:hypothetical protein